jgi:patatin-like phospholipase/acyl hydrolase
VRGFAEIIMLEAIQKVTKKPITKTFDWMSGTSTGGLLTLNLLKGCLLHHSVDYFMCYTDNNQIGNYYYKSIH